VRYESKFVFPAEMHAGFLNRVRSSCFLFSEIYWERKINNIYLDTLEFKNLYDNLNGVQNRVKHRIRWYGEATAVDKPVLEFKIKHGELGEKEFYWLPKLNFSQNFNFDDYREKIRSESDRSSAEINLMLADLNIEIPTLYNTYWRQYFLSGDKKLRLTIDRDLRYTRMDRWHSSLSTFSEDKIVVELKYNNPDIGQAGRIMQDLGLRAARNSKYVIGMRALYFNDILQQA